MKRSVDRILTTHAGSLPRPDDLWPMLVAKRDGQAYDLATFETRVQTAVKDAVRQQIGCGIDIVNDGELRKPNFLVYARERLSGFTQRAAAATNKPSLIYGRDQVDFPEYFEARQNTLRGRHVVQFVCHEPLQYVGHEAVQKDIDNLTAAIAGTAVTEAFLPSVAPGTIEHWLKNEHYADDETFVFAIAEAMREEYKAIVEAGFVLQIDDPDLADGWQIQSEMSLAEYRKFAEIRIEALNHALRGLPPDRVRFHMCWGSYHGPHKYDIPLEDIVDIILRVRAEVFSLEASNPRHEHEWRLWENVKLPQGAALIPGVVTHVSDVVEHPELVSQRLVRYANIVGRENVIAGTDCGLGMRVGHPKIVWAKLEALAEGARLASKELWG